MKLLSGDEIAVLREQTLSLVTEVGLKVDHEVVQQLLLAAGCTLAPDGRVRFPASLVADFVALQQARQAEEQTAVPLQTSQAAPAACLRPSGLMGCAFGPGPTRYYDYASGQTLPVSTPLAADMMRFASATPEIARVAPWFRQDIPHGASAVDDLVFALKLTRKTVGLDALNPAEVKYLAEISEIVTGRSGDSSYVSGSQCMTPPLTLGRRAAQEMLERRKYNVPRFYVATMAMVGASTPVDLLSATALAAAEALAGLCAAYVIYPEAALGGTAATTVLDMASGNAAMNAPESALLDAGVKELFDAAFGGHVTAHVRYAPTAKVPGLQAVAENYFGALACSRLLDTPPNYAGNGNLDMGGVGSPVQAMLDIEILKSLDWLDAGPGRCSERMSLEELSKIVRAGGNFLASEHTLRNYRSVWSPGLLLRQQPGAEWDGTERSLLDRCNAQWQDNLCRYEPPDWEEGVVRALEGVLERAQAELG